jgi:hypothetical protein
MPYRPSVAIKMNISNSMGDQSRYMLNRTVLNSLAEPPKRKIPTALSANMVARIHSVRPGCGSCGRG